jgi:hypothetical protein
MAGYGSLDHVERGYGFVVPTCYINLVPVGRGAFG